VSGILVIGGAYGVFWFRNGTPNVAGIVVTISRGSTFRAVADSLASVGLIRNRWTFELAGRLLGTTRQMKVGKYLFIGGQSNADMLRELSDGKSRLITNVTIPEGWRIEAVARRFETALGISAERFIHLCRDSAFLARNDITGPTLEGFLMPDTYAFYWQSEEEDVVARMIRQFKNFYVDSLASRQKAFHLSLNEVVTFASIVEAESGIPEERPVIAGVYWNRLRKRMRLEADPTIQYVLADGPRRLTYKDLQISSPYNTYKRIGLPPGPINNPGRSAIRAVLNPASHRYLYFVATGGGGHRFSETYAQHQQAIRKYHQARRSARRSAQMENTSRSAP
jgi:UPF0755 protein